MAALFLPMSLTWAAGDVSLNAFLQSELINIQSRRPGVSTIASIMSFLYVTYVSTTLCPPSHVHSYIAFQIASYTLLSSVLGLLVDTVLGRDDPCSVDFRSNTRTALIYVGGVGGPPSMSLGLYSSACHIDLLHSHLLHNTYSYLHSGWSLCLEPIALGFPTTRTDRRAS